MDYIITRVGDDNDYISHHGVLGMHWGYRKPEVSSPRRLGEKGNTPSRRKLLKEVHSSDRTNRDKFVSDSRAYLNNTKIGKEYNNSLKSVRTLNAAGIKWPGEIPREREYLEQAREYSESHKRDWASMTLKDLGYEDTFAGREYLIKKNII